MRHGKTVPPSERRSVESLVCAIMGALQIIDEPWKVASTSLACALAYHAAECAPDATTEDITEFQGQIVKCVEDWIKAHGGQKVDEN